MNSVNHQNAKSLVNNTGIYVKCHELPNFGSEKPNVERRIAVFHTTEIPNPKIEAPQKGFKVI